MPLNPVEVEALDMPDLADDLDQGRSDQSLAEPRRQKPCDDNQGCQPDQQFADCILHWPEEFRLGNDGDERPARKRDRGQHSLISLAVSDHACVKRLALVGIVTVASLLYWRHRG